MALILGTEYCKVDTNGRFKFPIALKKQLEGEDYRFLFRKSTTPGCLELWTYTSFEKEMDFLSRELNLFNPMDKEIKRRLSRTSSVLELDSNDRLMVPPEFKGVLGAAKEIVLQSTGSCIEIWERSKFDEMDNSTIDFETMINNRLGQLHGLSQASDAE